MSKKSWKHHLDEIQKSLDYLSAHKNENNKTYQKNWLKLSETASAIPKDIRNRFNDIPWTDLIKYKSLLEKGSEVMDPSLNIAAGIRWLFHKRDFATRRLKRKATWIEAVEDYKDILRRRLGGIKYNKGIMPGFLDYLKKLKKTPIPLYFFIIFLSLTSNIFAVNYDPGCGGKGFCRRWFCVPKKQAQIKVKCADLGINELEGPKAVLEISLKYVGQEHSWSVRHGQLLEECVFYRSKIKKTLNALKDFDTYCVRGDYVDREAVSEYIGSPVPLSEHHWIFHEFVTTNTRIVEFEISDIP